MYFFDVVLDSDVVRRVVRVRSPTGRIETSAPSPVRGRSNRAHQTIVRSGFGFARTHHVRLQRTCARYAYTRARNRYPKPAVTAPTGAEAYQHFRGAVSAILTKLRPFYRSGFASVIVMLADPTTQCTVAPHRRDPRWPLVRFPFQHGRNPRRPSLRLRRVALDRGRRVLHGRRLLWRSLNAGPRERRLFSHGFDVSIPCCSCMFGLDQTEIRLIDRGQLRRGN